MNQAVPYSKLIRERIKTLFSEVYRRPNHRAVVEHLPTFKPRMASYEGCRPQWNPETKTWQYADAPYINSRCLYLKLTSAYLILTTVHRQNRYHTYVYIGDKNDRLLSHSKVTLQSVYDALRVSLDV